VLTPRARSRRAQWTNCKGLAKKQLPSLAGLDRIVAVLNVRTSHWAACVADLAARTFTYHDSMAGAAGGAPGGAAAGDGLWRRDGARDAFVGAMRRCLADHAAALDAAAAASTAGPGGGAGPAGAHAARVAGVGAWPLADDGARGRTPQQNNKVDCGVFALAAAEALGAGGALAYGQARRSCASMRPLVSAV
jgi:hypothetical protein